MLHGPRQHERVRGRGEQARASVNECGRVWTSVCARVRMRVYLWAQSRRRMPRALRWVPQGCAHRRSRILLPSEVEPLPARILARAQHEVGVRPALPVRGPLVALPRLVGAILERILLRALCAGAARASLRARKHRHIRAVRMCRLYLRIGPPACVRWPRRPAELRRRVACRAKFRLHHGTPQLTTYCTTSSVPLAQHDAAGALARRTPR